MSDHIPTEIVIDILARVPAKPLVRFTLVCKLWYSIITNRSFITTHFNRFRNKNTQQLLIRFNTETDNDSDDDIECEEHYVLLTDNEKINENAKELGFPSDTSSSYLSVVGSCNGLVCLSHGYEQFIKGVVICNPVINKSRTIALPYKDHKPYINVIGFGFVPDKYEYKVVRFTYSGYFENYRRGRKRPLEEASWHPLEVEVFDQGGVEWRVIACKPPPHSDGFKGSRAFLHGAVHWVACGNMDENKIVGFDMTNEVFKEIDLPSTLEEKDIDGLSIRLLNDFLTVLYDGTWNDRGVSVWEMRVYGVSESWTNLYTISLPVKIIETLGFRRNGEILFTTKKHTVASFDHETKTLTNISIEESASSITVHNFMESLFLLTSANAAPNWFPNAPPDWFANAL